MARGNSTETKSNVSPSSINCIERNSAYRLDSHFLEHDLGRLSGYRHRFCYCHRQRTTTAAVVPAAIVALAVVGRRSFFLDLTAAP